MCGGNVHDHYIVMVASSKPQTKRLRDAAKNAVDLKAQSYFKSACRYDRIAHTPNNWIRYFFAGRRIVPTHYTIRSRFNGGKDQSNLKNWVVEVGSDGVSWVEIDRRRNNSELNGADITRTFNVRKTAEGRFIRLVNVGKSHSGYDRLIISSFEIFGHLIE
jgi:hypothetical protein